MVVWPEATQHWSLQAFGEANGGLREGLCQGVLPRTSAANVLVPMVSPSHPPPLQVGLVQSPMGSLLLPLGPNAHTTLCVPSTSEVSVSPSPVEVLQSNSASLQSLIL